MIENISNHRIMLVHVQWCSYQSSAQVAVDMHLVERLEVVVIQFVVVEVVVVAAEDAMVVAVVEAPQAVVVAEDVVVVVVAAADAEVEAVERDK